MIVDEILKGICHTGGGLDTSARYVVLWNVEFVQNGGPHRSGMAYHIPEVRCWFLHLEMRT